MTRTPKELTDSPDRAPQTAPLDLLAEVLSRIRLAGAILLRAEFSEPWAYESPPPGELARVLGPRIKRLILFHIFAEGRCWIRSSKGDCLEISEGEVAVLPYADQHVVGSPERVSPVPIGSILPAPPWHTFPSVCYGGGGARTTMVCGYLHCEDPIFDPVLRALPSLFSVRPPAGPAAAWVAASVQYALEASEGRRPASPGLAVRLPELLFSEVLRLYAESRPALPAGWLAALHDPVVGPALIELHNEPARRWTVAELARRTAYSRSTLNERFSRLLGRAPMRYLSEWRLQVAASLLRDTKLSAAMVAHRVGYESEEAFNRAFKRAMGSPPAQWRQHGAHLPAPLKA
jgi:AraC-like DNA-binding protein